MYNVQILATVQDCNCCVHIFGKGGFWLSRRAISLIFGLQNNVLEQLDSQLLLQVPGEQPGNPKNTIERERELRWAQLYAPLLPASLLNWLFGAPGSWVSNKEIERERALKSTQRTQAQTRRQAGSRQTYRQKEQKDRQTNKQIARQTGREQTARQEERKIDGIFFDWRLSFAPSSWLRKGSGLHAVKLGADRST